jgi:hypothetical protein
MSLSMVHFISEERKSKRVRLDEEEYEPDEDDEIVDTGEIASGTCN